MTAKLGETQETQCNLPTKTVMEHSDRLVRIETKLDTLSDNIERLFQKMDRQRETSESNSSRLTKLETEKSTAISIVIAVGSALTALASVAWTVIERLHDKVIK